METNKDLYELLIRMDEGQKFLIQRMNDIEDRLKDADRARGQIHDKIYQVTEDVFLVGQTVAQQRDVIKALSHQVEANYSSVAPILDNVKVFKIFRKWVYIILIAGGITGTTLWMVAKEWLLLLLEWAQRNL